jgi:pyruvate/2-oxoglutarate dehydrogenase complex dihydrolipoamide acyltransferase (E2) component
MFKKNVELDKAQNLTSWRKISIGSWKPRGDSAVYTQLELDVEAVLEYIEKLNSETIDKPYRIQFINYFTKALGISISENPQINSLIRMGKVYPRKHVDIFFHVVNNYKDGEDLSGFVFRDADKNSLWDIAQTYYKSAKEIKNGQNKEFTSVKKAFKIIPGFLSGAVLNFVGFILYTLNIWHPLLGGRDAFGGIMLTYIGSLGIDNGFTPIAPYTRIPIVVSVGTIKKRPYVINDQVVARKTVKVGIVFDHRLCDGVQMQKIMLCLEDLMNPSSELAKKHIIN